MYTPFDAAAAFALLLNLIRIMFYIGFLFYVIFAFIALRQIEVMRKTVVTPFSPVVFLLGLVHLLAAAGALGLAFISLM